MNNDMLIAGAIGFAPAIALMFWTLKNYTYPAVERPFFDDRKVFAMFAFGIVIGVAFATVNYYFFVGSAETLLVMAILFALVEELVKYVILNMRRFQQRIDTAFYSVSFGLGIGSTVAFGMVFYTLATINDVGILEILLLSVQAVQLVLLHGATTTTIGIGAAKGDKWHHLSQAILVHLAFNLLLIPVYSGPEFLGYFGLIAGTIFIGYYYLHLHRVLIPDVVNEALSRMKRASKR
jgi:hypothetical protein